MNKLVSVIIPCYNGEKFIDQSIESVYIQDYTPIELIVVDDESTDGSADRIKSWQSRFAEKGNSLKYVYQKNRGPGGATDTGLKHVTGEYLTLLDADDVLLPGAVRKKAEFLDENPDYAGVRNNGWRVSGDGRSLFITDPEEKKITDLFSALCDDKTNNWAGTYMIRTAILFTQYPDRNINPSRFGQNFQILLPVAYRQKFGFIDEPLMEYHIQKDSHSHSADLEVQYQKSIANINGWQDIFCEIIQWLVKDQQERKEYLNRYDAVSKRSAMVQAAELAHIQDMRRFYVALNQTGLVTLDDHIIFARIEYPFLVLPLRLARKIQSIGTKISKQKAN